MKYLSVVVWLLLGILYYWIWSSNTATCCGMSDGTKTEQVTPLSDYDKDETSDNSSDEVDTEALALAEKEAKIKADKDAEKAIADAEKTKEVTSVKTTDSSGARKLTFYFPYNSSNASYSAGTEEDLLEIVSNAKAEGKKVVISGHTDDRGDDDSNMRLGKWRADEVRKKLISKGLNSGQVTARSFGEEKPVATNDTSAGRQKNRRVELIIQ